MDEKLVYKKDQRLEEVEDKIADILSEAIYSYIIRKGLLKNVNQQDNSSQSEKGLTKES
ncbi:MAG: hypothetical protein AABY28_00545 [Candidatus Omnitrophota bacterium]